MFTCSSILILLASVTAGQDAAIRPEDRPAFEANRKLGAGINLGNALEAPTEGEWGMVLEARFFEEIRDAGFDSVRIPIRWSAHAEREAPYTIDPEFFERVDWAIEQALSRGLSAVINMHHYEELYADPDGERERFLGLWRQIAERYADQPAELYLEPLNEPHGNLNDAAWNAMIPEVIAAVREHDPDRFLIIGPDEWNNVRALPKLRLPESDRRLIATVHYYLPFQFTHQGASWVNGADAWLGTTWNGTPAEKQAIEQHFDDVKAWSKAHGRPIYLGEFGAYSRADHASRIRWTRFVREQAEARGFSFAYWEFGAGFGAYDRDANRWRPELKDALVPSVGRR